MQKHSNELNYARSSVYSLQYHLILVTKYRRAVLIDDVKTELEKLLRDMTEKFSGEIMEINIMPDHVHMLVDASPSGRWPASGRRRCGRGAGRLPFRQYLTGQQYVVGSGIKAGSHLPVYGQR